MTDKQIIYNGVDISECEFCDWKGSDIPQYRIRQASFEPICKGYNCYYKQLKRKEQECEELITDIKDIANLLDLDTGEEYNFGNIELEIKELKQQLNQLKAEVKSKTEYIQEQREIIDQYSKEIEMYKKCQGKRASKREEELKAELEQEKALKETYLACYKAKHEDIEGALFKLKQTLTEIKEIANIKQEQSVFVLPSVWEQILQIIDEVISE